MGHVGLRAAFCLALGQAPGLSPLMDPPVHMPSSQAVIAGVLKFVPFPKLGPNKSSKKAARTDSSHCRSSP